MRSSERTVACGAGAVGGALLLWALVTSTAARAAHLSAWPSSSWDRWDSGQYLSIARDGYSFGPCVNVANRGPGDMCGNAGWFPGYPYAIRVLGWTGVSHQSIGRWLSVVAFVAVLAILWFGFLSARPLLVSLPVMALAAVFPAVVYDGAIFPIAMTTAGMLGLLAAMQRERWLLAGACGAIAAVSYPSGLMIAAAAVAPLTMSALPRPARVRAALSVAGPLALGYLLVLLNYQRATGSWNAWFRIQEAYGYHPSSPLRTLGRQLRLLLDHDGKGWIGAQTMLVLALVIVVGVTAARRWADLGAGERGAVVAGGFLWLVPLILGGDLSLYRTEALLLPLVVVVIARAHRAVVIGAAVLALPLAYGMARLFFLNVLI